MRLTKKASAESGSNSRDQKTAETSKGMRMRQDFPLLLMIPVLGLEGLSWVMGSDWHEGVLWAQLALTLACLVGVVVARLTAASYPP